MIAVNYVGVYPSIGIRYRREQEDLGPLIESAVAELVSGTPVIEFLEYVAGSDIDWAREYEPFAESGRPRPSRPAPRT